MSQLAIVSAFADLPDTRRTAGQRHNQALCLALFTLAVAAGNRGFLAIGDWLKAYHNELVALFQPPKGRLPSESTIRRTLSKGGVSNLFGLFVAVFRNSTVAWRNDCNRCADILKRYRTSGLFQIALQTLRVEKLKRRYLERQPQTVEEVSVDLDFKINEDAVRQQVQLLGWRVYVTNKTEAQLTLKQARSAYRDEYLTERGFARLKGFPLLLTPIYLQREDHVTGLIRLLSIGLRVLTLLEFQVRRNLEKNQEKLAGLYVGNPKRETARPTAEILLAAFKEITLLLIEVNNEVYAHLTTLSPLQQRILVLLGFSTTIYTQLGGQSFTPE